METTDFFRCRIDAMINLRHPLAVLATRLPWGVIEAALAPKFERKDRPGQVIEGQDMLAPRLWRWWVLAAATRDGPGCRSG
jgi:IS5 family transposase